MAVTNTSIIDKITNRLVSLAGENALLNAERQRYEKLAYTWEERALKAEQKLADSVNWQVSSENNFRAYKEEQQRAIRLEAKLEKAAALLERWRIFADGFSSLHDIPGALALYNETCVVMFPEGQREEAAANGR
jgi:hypothetical protein